MYIEILAQNANPRSFNLMPETIFELWLMKGDEIIRSLGKANSSWEAEEKARKWARDNEVELEDIIENDLF